MKGFVPTPATVVDTMVVKLFGPRPPRSEDRLLDPGCGTGAFIEGVVRWCARHSVPLPRIVGVESDPIHLEEARRKLGHLPGVSLLEEDFLAQRTDAFDFIIGNPPYVPITALTEAEKAQYRRQFRTAAGRFDLYALFFEQASRLLAPGGRLVFITPEKFLYVQSAAPLRRAFASLQIEEIEFVAEETFEGLITYPVITTLIASQGEEATRFRLRNGDVRLAQLDAASRSWLPSATGAAGPAQGHTVADAVHRISCGVATGADGVFVLRTAGVPDELRPFARPTVSGREITVGVGMTPLHSMLIPYSESGDLLPEDSLGALGEYLRDPARQTRLLQRTCVARKPWYAFHENPPLPDLLRPKILCKDISGRPYFVADHGGELVPRHSVYYLVPKDPDRLDELCDFLNTQAAQEWLVAHCQRAANGFLRLQSHVLKQLPLPGALAQQGRLDLMVSF